MKKDIAKFNVGDTVDIAIKIVEEGKTRLQTFEGIVIAKKGSGLGESFTVRKISSLDQKPANGGIPARATAASAKASAVSGIGFQSPPIHLPISCPFIAAPSVIRCRSVVGNALIYLYKTSVRISSLFWPHQTRNAVLTGTAPRPFNA
jgi:hypothetical protein